MMRCPAYHHDCRARYTGHKRTLPKNLHRRRTISKKRNKTHKNPTVTPFEFPEVRGFFLSILIGQDFFVLKKYKNLVGRLFFI